MIVNDIAKPSLDELAHFGIKGMHWGVRKDDHPGVSRSTNKEAAKDAKEFTRAKVFYGEGAGTRRKLIKATVEGKSKRDPNYKKAFDHHLSRQDLSKHVDKARGERKRKDVTNTTVKTARGISHAIRGNMRYASALAAGLFIVGVSLHNSGIDKFVLHHGKTAYRNIRGSNIPARNIGGTKISGDSYARAQNLLRAYGIKNDPGY